MWVKLIRLPAAFSSLRRASSTSTGSVRKLVAVGIERLSSMKRASVAAGPRIGLSSASVGASAVGDAAAGAPSPSTAASTSSFVTRPRGPVPFSEPRSMPCAPAMRAATGVAFSAPFPAGAGTVSTFSAAGATGPAGAPAPAAIRHTTVPTDTVSSGSNEDLRDRSRDGSRQLGVDLVGGDLDQRVVHRHRVAGLDEPLQHGALGHGVAHLRDGHVDELGLGRRLGVAPAARGGSPLPAPAPLRPRPPRSHRGRPPPARWSRARPGSWSASRRRAPAPRRRPCRSTPPRAARRPPRGRRPASATRGSCPR